MIVGIVDDDAEKRQSIAKIVSDSGGEIIILQCGSLSGARRMLTDTALDLLILDIALPEHEDAQDAVIEGGIDLLSEVISSNRFNMPKQVIGLTALSEIYETAAAKFGGELWSVLLYDRASNDWADRLSAKIRHILRLKATAPTAEFGCDIGIVVALKSPELDAVLELPWEWTVHESPGDATLYHIGQFRRKDGTQGKAVVARAGQMGMPASTALATKLGVLFRPKCLAMVGICAGNKEVTAIGDLVAANPTWCSPSAPMAQI
jgi:CheY-like chemotaxis protein